jgi:S-adenosylmethionine synthetase
MRNIVVEKLTETPTAKREVELVERKGLGHPDSMADGVAEAISRALCKYYIDNFGIILHHNTDKVQISGGETSTDFGGGKIVKPIHILLSGQATNKAGRKTIPVHEIAIKSAKDYLKKIIPNLNVEKGTVWDCRINPGSADLQDVFSRQGVPSSNDTSLGVGFAPMTPLEKAVLNSEQFLNSPEYKKKKPEIGPDVKVMGYRNKDQMKITVAAATLCHLIKDVDYYVELKEEVNEDLTRFLSDQTDLNVEVFLNTADNPNNGKSGCYLTVTGTSAEMGDSGAVGRGNRVNGLITPYRPMTMEAAAGKNPVNHVGKIYNILAFKAAGRIISEINGIEEVRVRILSQIGKPIDQPLVANIEFKAPQFNSLKPKAMKIVDDELANITNITEQILSNRFSIF